MQSTPRFSNADLAYASAVDAMSPRLASRMIGIIEPIRFDSILDRFDDLLERDPAFRAEDFEERRVGFECCSVARRLFHEIQAEVPRRCGGGSD